MAKTVEFDVVMRDKGATTTATKVEKGFSNITKAQDATKTSAGKLWQQMAAGIGVANLVSSAIRGVTNAFKGGITDALEFEKQLANVSTLVDTSTVDMGEYQSAILGMAGELGSATDLTEGLYQALSAGVEPAKAIEFVGTSAQFAQAALTDTLGAVDLLSTVINAYGMNASDAGHVSDVLFQTIKDGKTTGEALAGALGRVIPAAATMGVNIETVSAALATMTKGGITTDEAVTALNATLMAVIKPSQEAAQTAADLGLDFSKAGIEGAGGFQQWLVKLKAAVGDNETKMAKLFPNVRALKAVLALTGTQAGEFNRIMENMSDVTGNVDEAFEKQQATVSAMATALENELSAAFTKYVLPALGNFIRVILENKDMMIDFVKTIGGLVEGLVNLTSFMIEEIPKVTKVLVDLNPVLGMVIGGYEELFGLIRGDHISLIEDEIRAERTHVDQMEKVRDRLNEMRDAVGLNASEMRALTSEFIDIEDPIVRMSAQINALKLEQLAKDAGLTDAELQAIKDDFVNTEDPARRYRQILQAIKDGEYDNAFGNISDVLIDSADNFSIVEEDSKATKEEIEKTTTAVNIFNQELLDIPFSTTISGLNTMKNSVEDLGDYYGGLENAVLDMVTEQIEAEGHQRDMNDVTQDAIDHVNELESSNEGLFESFTALSTTINAALGFFEKLGLDLGGLETIIGGVTGGINSIGAGLGAITGAGSGFLGFLQSASGYINVFSGAISIGAGIIGGIIGLLSGKSGELKAAERNIAGITGLTEDWGAAIEELAKEIGGAGSAEKAFGELLPGIIADADLTIQNFDALIGKTRDIVATWQWAGGSIEDVEETFGNSFQAMIGMAEDLGQEGGDAIIGLMELADQFGLKIDEIALYKAENMSNAVDGWRIAMEHFEGVSVPALEDIIRLEDMIAENQGLVDAIQGAEDALIGLSNAGRINEDTFQSFEDIAMQAMQDLQDKGFSVSYALSSDTGLQGLLERLIYLSEEYGFAIDDDTQKLIDQGIEAGLLSDNTKSEQEIMIDGFNRIGDTLDRIALAFGVEMPDALDTFAERSTGSFGSIQNQLNGWNNSISDIYDNLGDVEQRIDDIGDTHDDVMFGHSIIPDLDEWKKRLDYLNDNELKELKENIEEIGSEHSQQTETFLFNNNQIANSIDTLIEKQSDLIAGNGMIPIDFKVEDVETELERDQQIILDQIADLENQIRLNEGAAIDALIQGWPEISEQLKNENEELLEQILKLKENMVGFQHGTPKEGFTVPPGYPRDSFPIGVSSGEKVYVQPAGGGQSNTDNSQNNWNIYVTIQGSPGGDTPRQLMEKFWQGLRLNEGGYRTKIQENYFQRVQ